MTSPCCTWGSLGLFGIGPFISSAFWTESSCLNKALTSLFAIRCCIPAYRVSEYQRESLDTRCLNTNCIKHYPSLQSSCFSTRELASSNPICILTLNMETRTCTTAYAFPGDQIPYRTSTMDPNQRFYRHFLDSVAGEQVLRNTCVGLAAPLTDDDHQSSRTR